MNATALLHIESLRKRFGALIATDDVCLSVTLGETHALIGPNGAGKTTLITLLQGQLSSDSGSIHLDGRNITRLAPHQRARLGLARSFQITSVIGEFTALENVRLAVQAQLGHSFRLWRGVAGDTSMNSPAIAALDRTSLDTRKHIVAQDLSHGERRQLELAMALAMKPRLLLLDEPMAGMGKQDAQRMTHLLAQLKGEITMLLVEHDMDAVFALADRLSVLVAGRIIATGSPAQIRSDAHVQSAYLGHG